MKILLIGLSHKTAPLEVRERLAFSPLMLRSALTHFDATHRQAHLAAVREGVILSTCNRLEIYALVRDPAIATQAIVDFLAHSGDIAPPAFSEHLYIYHDEKATHHLMRVAAGLDSMVLGEPQILGQIKDAYEAALSQRAAGTVLSSGRPSTPASECAPKRLSALIRLLLALSPPIWPDNCWAICRSARCC